MTFRKTSQPCPSRTRRAPRRAAVATAACLTLLALSATASTFTVTSTADTDGAACATDCTLRQAINAANSTFGFSHQIEFGIAGKGPHLIQIGSPLPTIIHGHVTIDGYSQAGATANTLAVGDDADLRIVLKPTAHVTTAVNGLVLCADTIIVRGLSILGFEDSGIRVGDGGSAGFGPCGAKLPADGSIVAGNFIGLDPDGVTAFGNQDGVFIDGSANVRVGGIVLADRNVISGNGASQITTLNPSVAGTQILGNYLGTDASGTQDRGAVMGVRIATSSLGVTVGDPAAPNLIAFNHNGIAILTPSSTGHTLFANDFAENENLGIDLCATNCGGGSGDSVTLNDADDADTGANNLQNFPVLTSATLEYGELTVEGSLDIPHIATPLPQAVSIALYANGACHSPGHGQGDVFLGVEITNLVDGGVTTIETFSITQAAAVALGTIITATATDDEGNTSEFSQCVEVFPGEGIFKDSFDA